MKLKYLSMFYVYITLVGTLPPRPLKRGGREQSFQNFRKMEGGSDFSHKKGGVGKIAGGGGVVFKKRGITHFHTN